MKRLGCYKAKEQLITKKRTPRKQKKVKVEIKFNKNWKIKLKTFSRGQKKNKKTRGINIRDKRFF